MRSLESVELCEDGDFLHIDVRGSGFLRNMVRLMVGTLVEIGKGKRPVDDIPRLLAREPGVRAGVNAPPQGLCLMEVYYPPPDENRITSYNVCYTKLLRIAWQSAGSNWGYIEVFIQPHDLF